MTPALPLRDLLRHSWRAWWDSQHQPRGPQWLQWVWTFVFSSVLAAAFTLFGFIASARNVEDWLSLANWGKWYWRNGLVCWSIGFVIHGLFFVTEQLAGRARLAALRGWRRSTYYAGIPILGVFVGWPLGYWLAGAPWGTWSGARVAITWTILLCAIMTAGFQLYWMAREREAAAERRATEAQLRLLQAQIEPHFLFNTLANVLSLIDADAPKAKRMLEAFIEYLRGSLSQLRRDDSTLGQELAMAEAYLTLMQTRMGERLNFSIELADEALRTRAVPPLLLQPLVENAIHHGLECCVDGGRVTVSARVDAAGTLELSVDDNGLGLDAPARRVGGRPGNGVALDNMRARLLSRFGPEASVMLEPRQPQGTRAVLRLPAQASA